MKHSVKETVSLTPQSTLLLAQNKLMTPHRCVLAEFQQILACVVWDFLGSDTSLWYLLVDAHKVRCKFLEFSACAGKESRKNFFLSSLPCVVQCRVW